MNISRIAAVFGLAAVAFGTLAALPASAQYYHHPMQRHQAARLDRKAAHAAYNGNYAKAARLRGHAAHLRHAANHGY